MTIKKTIVIALLFVCGTVSHAEPILKTINGQNISWSSLKGKWVLINYWASWCHTCMGEIPDLNAFYRKYGNKNVVLYGVNYDMLPAYTQKKMARKYNINFPGLLNDPSDALGLGDISGVPVTFVFNPKGRLVNTLYGGQTERSLTAAMR